MSYFKLYNSIIALEKPEIKADEELMPDPIGRLDFIKHLNGVILFPLFKKNQLFLIYNYSNEFCFF